MEDNRISTDVASANGCKQSAGGWVFPALLLVVLGVAVWLGRQESADKAATEKGTSPAMAWTPSPQPVGKTVGLTVDFGNGTTRQFAALPWREGLTIELLMQEAADFRPGITFKQQGQGELGFLLALDGLENQGAGGRNWQYRVNGQHGEMSFCIQPLESGDQVLWGFALEE